MKVCSPQIARVSSFKAIRDGYARPSQNDRVLLDCGFRRFGRETNAISKLLFDIMFGNARGWGAKPVT